MITVWHAELARCDSFEAIAESVLSATERAIADRIHLELDRRHYRARRAMLRILLASELGCEPAALTLETARHGKPFVANPATDLAFSVSHASDRVVIALARGRRLGVDIERVDVGLDHQRLARRLFSASERTQLAALPPDERAVAFCRAWTCKEAVVKATGAGLFETELGALEVAIDTRTPVATTAPGLWLAEIDVGPAFRSTLASDGPLAPIVSRSWTNVVDAQR
jgi:4'-phosphopantetheinyl transferase